ncbi:MAG TPA: hypothetical protein VGL20_05490 [Candidatus Dormibacteraeota bacterium]|jgi:hypothetical protein
MIDMAELKRRLAQKGKTPATHVNAPAAAAPGNPRTLIEQDAALIGHLDALWAQSSSATASVPGSRAAQGPLVGAGVAAGPQSLKHEHGCWIIQRADGTLRWHDWPVGQRDAMTPPAPNLGPGEIVIAEYHTHPNSSDEGYNNGPSQADIGAKDATHVGICRSAVGGRHWY